MKCPVTTLRQLAAHLSFSGNGADIVVQHQDVPQGAQAWEAALKINRQLTKPHNRQPSTVCGNLGISGEGVTLKDKINEGAHRSLRAMIGRIGRCVDWEKGELSKGTVDALQKMEAAKKTYADAVRSLVDLHDAQALALPYTAVDQLLVATQLGLEGKPLQEAQYLGAVIQGAEYRAQEPLQNLVRHLRRETSFRLIGDKKPLSNRFQNNEREGTPLELLYCCKYGAIALLDTTRIPVCYSTQLQSMLDKGIETVRRVDEAFQDAPQLFHAAIFGAAEKSLAEMQVSVAHAGTFEEINDDKKASLAAVWLVDYLGLADEGVYNRARERKQSAPVYASSGAICPVTGRRSVARPQ